MEQKKEKKYIVGSILCGLLTAFGIAASVISLIDGGKGTWILVDITHTLIFVAIAYYAFIGYKKPHGNMLKYIILFGTALRLTPVYTFVQNEEVWLAIFSVIAIGLTCYIAGRLDRVKENLVLMIMVAVCNVISFVLCVHSGAATIGNASGLIIWLDICVAYFLRYKQHREAGLIDAPKK